MVASWAFEVENTIHKEGGNNDAANRANKQTAVARGDFAGQPNWMDRGVNDSSHYAGLSENQMAAHEDEFIAADSMFEKLSEKLRQKAIDGSVEFLMFFRKFLV